MILGFVNGFCLGFYLVSLKYNLFTSKLAEKANSPLNELINNLSKLIELDGLVGVINLLDGVVGVINLSNELLETLKIINFCTDCEKKFFENNKDDLIGVLEGYLNSLEISVVKENIDKLSGEMLDLDNQLSKELCDSCQRKKLINKYGDEELGRLLNQHYKDPKTIKWIPFNELVNIEHLARGGFSIVYKATWINYYNTIFEEKTVKTVVLKKIKIL